MIKDFQGDADKFPMAMQDQYTETNYELIDLDKPGPLQDARVRCALSMAIDREEINDLVNAGLPKIANGLFSPGQEGYLEDNGFDPAQNVDEAKKLIDDYKSSTGSGNVEVHLGSVADATHPADGRTGPGLLEGHRRRRGARHRAAGQDHHQRPAR